MDTFLTNNFSENLNIILNSLKKRKISFWILHINLKMTQNCDHDVLGAPTIVYCNTEVFVSQWIWIKYHEMPLTVFSNLFIVYDFNDFFDFFQITTIDKKKYKVYFYGTGET